MQKFSELLTFPNVFENFDPTTPELVVSAEKQVKMKGQWHEYYFKNSRPITLELACGRAEYSLALAERHPERNYIGIDIKGARIWKGARKALEDSLKNVAFLRTKIEFCSLFFEKDEVDETWITFPDPFLKSKKYNRRLTSPNFLSRYRQFLRSKGIIHLKTDSEELFEHTMEVLTEQKHMIHRVSTDVYGEKELPHPDLDIKTYYERMHLAKGKTIKYLQFSLNPSSSLHQNDSSPVL